MQVRKCAGLFLAFLLPVSSYAQQGLTKHRVGFKSLIEFDSTRPAIKEQPASDKARAIQLNLWYPAEPAGTANTLTLKDYFLLKGKETDPTVSAFQQDMIAQRAIAKNYNTSMDSVKHLLNVPYTFKAQADAPVKSGKFPVVVLIHNDPVGFASLAEQLAEAGFVVVNFPLTGTTSKEFDWQTISGVQTEIRDAQFVIDRLKNFPEANTNSIIALGYSYGAMAAAAYQLQNSNVKAVISLDGGIGSIWGGSLLFGIPDFNIARLTKPLLHLWSDRENYYDHKWIENYICADRYLIRFSDLRHGDFVEGVLFEKLWPGFTINALGKVPENNRADYNKMCSLAIEFAKSVTAGQEPFSRLNSDQYKLIRIKRLICDNMTPKLCPYDS
jgi:dienelactone hydrolase